MAVINLLLLLIISTYITSPKGRKFEIDRFNNGRDVPKAYHSFAVLFVKKPGFDYEKYHVLMEAYYPAFSQMAQDPTYDSPLICAGALLTRRWILTRATPIAFYPTGSYHMVGGDELEFDKLDTHEIDFVLIHPEHYPGDHSTDVALVRTRDLINFTPTLHGANLGFGNLQAGWDTCTIVLWSWIDNKKQVKRTERELKPKHSGCLWEHYSRDQYYFQFFICLAMMDFMPCMINNGAPILCDGTLIGVFSGNGTGSWCVGENEFLTYAGLRIDQGPVRDWIEHTLEGPIKLETKVINENKTGPRMLEECPEPNGATMKRNFILLTLFVIILRLN